MKRLHTKMLSILTLSTCLVGLTVNANAVVIPEGQGVISVLAFKKGKLLPNAIWTNEQGKVLTTKGATNLVFTPGKRMLCVSRNNATKRRCFPVQIWKKGEHDNALLAVSLDPPFVIHNSLYDFAD